MISASLRPTFSLLLAPIGMFYANDIAHTQLAHDVETTLGFGCFLLATSDHVVTTLSQHFVSDVVTTTKT